MAMSRKTTLRPAAFLPLLAALLGWAATAAAEGTPAICGDVNASGTVTTSDALNVLKKSVGQNVVLGCLDHVDRYGSPTDPNATTWMEPGYLLGRRVTIARDATVTAVGLISRQEEPASFRMALYSDNNGEPDALLVSTQVETLKVGSQEIPVTPTKVDAGQYWLVGNFEAKTYVAANEDAPPAPENTVKYRALAFGSPLPDPFGAAITYGETDITYWVKVSQ